MSGTTIERDLGGTLQRFRLAHSHIPELEQHAACGVVELARKLVQGAWRSSEVRTTIRLGLTGGGMDPNAAETLVSEHVDNQPLAGSAALAADICWAAVIGAESVDKMNRHEAEGEADGIQT